MFRNFFVVKMKHGASSASVPLTQQDIGTALIEMERFSAAIKSLERSLTQRFKAYAGTHARMPARAHWTTSPHYAPHCTGTDA